MYNIITRSFHTTRGVCLSVSVFVFLQIGPTNPTDRPSVAFHAATQVCVVKKRTNER